MKEMNNSRICKMGIISMIAAYSAIAVPFVRFNSRPGTLLDTIELLLKFVFLLGPIIAVVLGIASLVRIKQSDGRLYGRGWAWTGLIIGTFVLLFMLCFIVPLINMMANGKLAK